MTPAVYHPEAEVELNKAADRYESRQRHLGERFLDAVDAAIRAIWRSPEGCRDRRRASLAKHP